MATYASKEDIDNAHGPDLLLKIADHDKDGIPDADLIDRNLKSASGIINGYLKAKYTLPLAGTSSLLVELCVDIAVYKMCLMRSVRTAEMRVRYDDAIAMLKDLAAGKSGLVLDGDDGSADPQDPGVGSQPTYSGRSINTYRAS
jgi:phage gp36-like protein